MKIEKEIIADLARQIYMNLSEEDTEKLCTDIGKLAESTDVLKEVDISNVKADVCVIEHYNVFRKDEVNNFGETEALLQSAKETHGNMFKIPKIL